MDAAFLAMIACLGLSYFSEWFLLAAMLVVVGIIGWLWAQSLGWVK